MTFQTLPINIVGQSYASRSLPLSAQSTINLYPEANPTGRTETALQNWYGSIRRVTGTYGVDRGSHNFNGTLYKVSGTSLIKVDSSLNETLIGTISGSNRCVFANDGTNMVITTGGTTYQYDGTTLSTITDPDLETPDSVTNINNQMVYDGNGGRWVVATPGDPDDVPDINYAAAESNGDDLVRTYEFNQTLYLMGCQSIESWFNSGSGSPPFTRIEGGIIKKGLLALHSVANSFNFIYMMGADKQVYQITGYQLIPITPPAIAHQFAKDDWSDAVGMTITMEGQNIYIISSSNANKTYAYSEELKIWFQPSFGVDGERHIINSYQYVYGKHLITDYRNGNVLELDPDTFTDDSEVQIRQRDSAPINGIQLGQPGKRLIMSSLELIMETGVGLATGQGSDPSIEIGVSIDGGRTFNYQGNPYISPGNSGDYITRVRLDKMISFYDLIVRIRVSDPIFISIHSASIDVDLAGW